MSESFYDDSYEDDYEDAAPNAANAETDLVAQYFSPDRDEDLDEYDPEGMYADAPDLSSTAPADLGLAGEGFDLLGKAAFQERLGQFAQPLADLAQASRAEAAAHEAWQQEQEQAGYEEGQEVAAGLIADYERSNGKLSLGHEAVMAAAEQVYADALRAGYEDGPALGREAILAACELARYKAITESALRKA